MAVYPNNSARMPQHLYSDLTIIYMTNTLRLIYLALASRTPPVAREDSLRKILNYDELKSLF